MCVYGGGGGGEGDSEKEVGTNICGIEALEQLMWMFWYINCFSRKRNLTTSKLSPPSSNQPASLLSSLYSHRKTSPNQATFTPISDNSQEESRRAVHPNWDLGLSHETNEVKRSASTKKQQQQKTPLKTIHY